MMYLELSLAVLLALPAADLWRRRRAFKARMDAIDTFMEWDDPRFFSFEENHHA
jgi:hypothetical protein